MSYLSVRTAAFAIRAYLAGSDTAGTDLNLVIAQLVIYSVGFFSLLYSAYTLVLDRFVVPLSLHYTEPHVAISAEPQCYRNPTRGRMVR